MNDARLTQIEQEKQNALNQVTNQYNTMINNTDKFYQDQVQLSKDYAQKQQEIQQANTDFAIEKIEQEKQQAEKDYTKEQKGAYADYQKQVNDYGVNAEQMASSGLNNSGYSESSKVSMYNTYQNRIATSRESFDKAILNYNNGIKDAQLQNNSALAQIMHDALKEQLQLSLEGFQYKNSLLQESINQKNTITNMYQNKWATMLNQIQAEKELEEKIRQFNEQMAYQKQRDAVADAQWNKTYNSKYGSGIELTNSAGSTYGYFSNGYQPKGINGYGAVSKTGNTVLVTKSNGTLATQNVWKTPDGTQWYWNGHQYVKYNGKSKVV